MSIHNLSRARSGSSSSLWQKSCARPERKPNDCSTWQGSSDHSCQSWKRLSLGLPDECANLERLERLYEQLLNHLESKETELGVGDAPPNLKLKIQEYTNILQEIRKRLDKLANRAEPDEPLFRQG